MLECNLPVVKNYLNRITLCFFFLTGPRTDYKCLENIVNLPWNGRNCFLKQRIALKNDETLIEMIAFKINYETKIRQKEKISKESQKRKEIKKKLRAKHFLCVSM